MGDPVRVVEGRQIEGDLPVLGHHVAVDHGAHDVQIFQVVQKHDVGALAWGDGAQLVLHAEAGGGVDGHHLDGGHDGDAQAHGHAQDIVEVPLGHQGVGVGVVGDEVREAGVDAGLGDGGGQLGQVEPGRAVAQLGVLPEAHLGEHVLGPGGLVAAAHAAGHIRVEPPVGLGDGVVARDDLVGRERLGQLAVGVVGAGQHAGEVHHLAEAHHPVPGHGLGDLFGAHEGAGVLEAGHGRDAGGRGDHGLQGRAGGIVHHHLHAFKPQHVAHLMGVPVDAHGAMGHHGPGVLAGAEHGGFHMDVPIEEARGDHLAGGIDHEGVRADAVVGARSHVGDAPAGDGHVHVVLNLGGAHVHESCVGDDGVGWHLALGHGGQGAGALPERLLAEMVQHGISLSLAGAGRRRSLGPVYARRPLAARQRPIMQKGFTL